LASLRTGTPGQLHDGDIWLNSAVSIPILDVKGDVFANSLYSPNSNITGRIMTRGESLPFPVIDTANYYSVKAMADNSYYAGGRTWDNSDFNTYVNSAPDYSIIYVAGNLTLNGPITVSGKHTLVVMGTGTALTQGLAVNGDVRYEDSSAKLVALIVGNLMPTNTGYMDGFYYARRSGTGRLSVASLPNDTITFGCGGVSFDIKDASCTSINIVAVADPDLRSTDLPFRLHLPGYETANLP
jgi:hypothetical protein